MQDWEFLLQQEGDESWLPIAENNLKIAQGKYRVVGYCRQPDLDVEIRITFQSQEAGKFLRRSQRSRRTNHQGLVAILPFTDLNAGMWEFCCNPLPTAEIAEQLTPKILSIVVISAEVENEKIIEAATEFMVDSTADPQTIEDLHSFSHSIIEDSPILQKLDSEIKSDRSTKNQPESLADIELFHPRRVEAEVKQILPLSGQILPPNISVRTNISPRKIPELPRFSLPQVEEYIASVEDSDEELDFIAIDPVENTEDSTNISDFSAESQSEIDEQFQALNLKEKFWSKINKIDDSKDLPLTE
jgi:hypothetical protein